jgi:predicted metallo-beta-lactamase superfamily hydrolase
MDNEADLCLRVRLRGKSVVCPHRYSNAPSEHDMEQTEFNKRTLTQSIHERQAMTLKTTHFSLFSQYFPLFHFFTWED